MKHTLLSGLYVSTTSSTLSTSIFEQKAQQVRNGRVLRIAKGLNQAVSYALNQIAMHTKSKTYDVPKSHPFMIFLSKKVHQVDTN